MMTQNKHNSDERITIDDVNDFLKKQEERNKKVLDKSRNSEKVKRYAFSNKIAFDSLTKQQPRNIHKGKQYNLILSIVEEGLKNSDVSDTGRIILENTHKYLIKGVFNVRDAEEYLIGNFWKLSHGSTEQKLTVREQKINVFVTKQNRNRNIKKTIYLMVGICLIAVLIIFSGRLFRVM